MQQRNWVGVQGRQNANFIPVFSSSIRNITSISYRGRMEGRARGPLEFFPFQANWPAAKSKVLSQKTGPNPSREGYSVFGSFLIEGGGMRFASLTPCLSF